MKKTTVHWITACCLEHEGCSRGMSVTVRSRPMRYALWRCIWSKSTGSKFKVSTAAAAAAEKKRRRAATALRTDLLVTLENVKSPPDKRLAGLGRLIVLEQRARPVRVLDRVRRGSEQARRRESRLGLVVFGFGFGQRRRRRRWRWRCCGWRTGV
jgi:hypothetical protein